jgi:hypothetical protein
MKRFYPKRFMQNKECKANTMSVTINFLLSTLCVRRLFRCVLCITKGLLSESQLVKITGAIDAAVC